LFVTGIMKKIALFIPSMRGGGAERVSLSLAKGFISEGHNVHLILVNAEGPLMKDIPEGLVVHNLKKRRTITSILSLAKNLRLHKYDALISFMSHANIVSITASKLVFFKGRIVLTEHNSLSHNLFGKNGLKYKMVAFGMRIFYRYADKIIAVSNSLAKELTLATGEKKIYSLYNPIDINHENTQEIQPSVEAWRNESKPLILGLGRLNPQKNFEFLINSFNTVIKETDCQLLILGEGPNRQSLENLISSLKINDKVLMPGFVDNPGSYLERASVFVLSSSWEGFGLVIAEALAQGVTVVSTDCPVGPSEILRDGKYGYLVPVNDEKQMAKTIIYALKYPLDSEHLKKRAADFSIEKVSQNYLNLIFEEK